MKNTGLYPLRERESYLSGWAARNEQVPGTSPEERLVIIPTGQIAQRAYEIADLAALPRYSVRHLKRTDQYRNPLEREIIREIDRNFFRRKSASALPFSLEALLCGNQNSR